MVRVLRGVLARRRRRAQRDFRNSLTAAPYLLWGTFPLAATIGEALSAIADNVKDAFVKLGANIASLFTPSEAAETAATQEPGFIGQIGEYLKDNFALLTGAALTGAGAAGLLASSKHTAYVVPAPVAPSTSHVENEQMRAINGMMKARMMAANPEYMAQMMGRGA